MNKQLSGFRIKPDVSSTVLATDHVSVVSSRGYVVKAVSGSANSKGSKVSLTSYISKTNKGNTSGFVFGRSVQLRSANGSAATVISA
jgi:hypothetical protein